MEVWQLTIRNRSAPERGTLDCPPTSNGGSVRRPTGTGSSTNRFIETSYERRRRSALRHQAALGSADRPWTLEHRLALCRLSCVEPETRVVRYRQGILPRDVRKSQPSPPACSGRTLARQAGNWLDPCASLQQRDHARARRGSDASCTRSAAPTRAEEARTLVAKVIARPEMSADALASRSERWDALLSTWKLPRPITP